MNRTLYILGILVIILGSCCHRNQETAGTQSLKIDSTYYAKGFNIKYYPKHIEVDIIDPWAKNKILQKYILISRETPIPNNLPSGTIIKTPVERAIVYSSVHIAIIEALGEIDKIVGVCETQYIKSKTIQSSLKSQEIADLGKSSSPNLEKMIDLEAEIIIASPFENVSYGAVEKTDLAIVEAADWMENHPLGRTEWIRLYGLLFGQREKADSIFYESMSKYNELKKLASQVTTRPTLLSERRYGNSWGIAAGESYMAIFYKDAGADYIFQDIKGRGSVQYSFETVLDRAIDAELWVLKYHAPKNYTYSDLRKEYESYEEFAPFKNRKIYGCNSANTSYYEDITLHPEWILKDLVHTFQPQLLPNYSPRYFIPLE